MPNCNSELISWKTNGECVPYLHELPEVSVSEFSNNSETDSAHSLASSVAGQLVKVLRVTIMTFKWDAG